MNLRNLPVEEKLELVMDGEYLDTFIKDVNPQVRAAVARQNYGLETLVFDESPMVRAAVARQSYGHNILINDSDRRVREAVIEEGYYDTFDSVMDSNDLAFFMNRGLPVT